MDIYSTFDLSTLFFIIRTVLSTVDFDYHFHIKKQKKIEMKGKKKLIVFQLKTNKTCKIYFSIVLFDFI